MPKHNNVSQVTRTVLHSRRLRVLLVSLFVLGLGLGVAIVPVESRSGRDGNILTVEDGLWWSVTTITGVGFGDLYPVTTTGRVVGAILEVFGVILFGAVIALVAVSLLRYQEDFYVRRIMRRLDEVEEKIDDVRKHVDFLIKGKT